MAHDRSVAGIRCSEVLTALPDYVEGALPADAAGRVEAHLAGCDWCERFGGSYGAAVGALRRRLGEPAPVPSALRERLRTALAGGAAGAEAEARLTPPAPPI